mgnify:CR=1 FL=1
MILTSASMYSSLSGIEPMLLLSSPSLRMYWACIKFGGESYLASELSKDEVSRQLSLATLKRMLETHDALSCLLFLKRLGVQEERMSVEQ